MRNSQSGTMPLLLLIGIFGIAFFIAFARFAPFQENIIPKNQIKAAGNFLDNFDGNPSTPQAFSNDPASANWDIAVQSRDASTWQTLEPMEAQHGPDCAPPLDANNNLVTHHQTGSYEQAVFKCKDHIMTAINAGGYGVIYLTPNQIADFTNGEVVIKVDVTTLRTSERDWWDIWVTPYEENLQLPFDQGDVDLNGVPKRAIHISNEGNANGNGTGFIPKIYKNFQLTNDFRPFTGDYNWWTGYESFMKSSPKQRTTFELRLSKTHLKFGIPAGQLDQDGKPINNGQAFWWIDKDISPLDWSKGIVQFGHHSYNPQKDCTPDPSKKSCYPNTWHWDTVSISNSTPFTIIKADKRVLDGSASNDTINFNSLAPTNSYMRFSAIGTVDYSLDNGTTWQRAIKQPSSALNLGPYHYEHLTSYFIAVPVGTKQVKFRFSSDNWYNGPFQAKDFALWSQTELTSSPTGSFVPSPSVTQSTSSIPTSTPLPSPVASVLLGDINGDGKVNIFDYNLLLTDFGAISGVALRSDINKSGKVDIFDYNLLLTHFH